MTDVSEADALSAFLHAYGAKPGDKIDTAYRTLAARLAGKSGQCVLMIERDASMSDPCGGDMFPLRESFSLGVLEADVLRLDPHGPEAPWTFPTSRFAKKGDHHFTHVEDGSVHIREGGMCPWYASVFYRWLEQDVDLQQQRHPELAQLSIGVGNDGPKQLSLHIGNDEIGAWCLERHAMRIKTIAEMAKMLGADPMAILATPLLGALQNEVDRLRAADEAGDAAAREPIRAQIRFLLGEAERLGMKEPFIQRLRAAHPAK